VKKVEKKYGIRLSTKHSRGTAGAKNTTLWYEREEDRERDYNAFLSNGKYKNVKKMQK